MYLSPSALTVFTFQTPQNYPNFHLTMLFLKNFQCFLGGVKGWVEKSFLIENLKIEIGNSFAKYVGINVKQCQKVLFCQFHSIWV